MDCLRAVIDIGSSAVKYGIYDFSGETPKLVTEGDPVATSLGKGMTIGSNLKADARSKTLEVLRGFRREIDDAGAKIDVVSATEAVRRAADKVEFLDEVRDIVGPEAEVRCIEASEEIEWGLVSARATLDLPPGKTRLFIDPGGSSNDLSLEDEGHVTWKSVPFGMNDLLQTCWVDEQRSALSPDDVDRLQAFLREKYAQVKDFIGPIELDDIIGTSGAALAIGAVLEDVQENSRMARIGAGHGRRVTLEELNTVIEKFMPLEAADRRKIAPCLSPTRSIIFVHGALIYSVLLEELGLDSFLVNGFGMKLGGLIIKNS